jgi:hypothetical protein
MNENRIVQLLEQQNALLRAILEQLQPKNQSPNVTKRLDEFPDFDWEGFGAKVLERDRKGFPGRIEYRGLEYVRRCKNEDIWFNRKEPDGSYSRLITFTNQKLKQIPEEIRDEW